MSPGVPYVSVRSNDVLNGSLDLVLRLCTHVDAVWRVRCGLVVKLGFFYCTPYCQGEYRNLLVYYSTLLTTHVQARAYVVACTPPYSPVYDCV